MVKVVVFKGQYRITIPKELAEAKGWDSGTRLRFIEDSEGNTILKEIESKPKKKNEKRGSNKRS